MSSLISNWDKTKSAVGHDVQFFKLYSYDGKKLKDVFSIDFVAEKLGSPHQMRFGAYALYGLQRPMSVSGR